METRRGSTQGTARLTTSVIILALAGLLAGAVPAGANSATLSVTTTTGVSDPAAGVSRIFTVSGTSNVPRQLYVKYRAPGGAPCAPAASEDTGTVFYYGSSSPYDGRQVDGTFSIADARTWDAAGTFMFCFWLAESRFAIATPFTQTITFRRPTGTITATINPVTPRPGQTTTITVTGASETPAQVFATTRRAGGAGCAATFSEDTGGGLISGESVDGAFSLSRTLSFPDAGAHLLCLWLAQSSSDPSPIAGPQPQPFNVARPPSASQPARASVASRITIRRTSLRAGRYSGRVTTLRECRRNRVVVLRRVGSGLRAFARTRTRLDGTFTLRRPSRLRGRVYAVVTTRNQGPTTCRSSSSTRIRG